MYISLGLAVPLLGFILFTIASYGLKGAAEYFAILIGGLLGAAFRLVLALALLAREMDAKGAFAHIVKRLYEHGVASGDAGCCGNLVNLYHNMSGRGSAEDYAHAVELYELGSDRGDTQSMINLGYIYYYGRGCERDYTRAYECYARAALTGTNPEAYWKLGDLYASGKGVRKSDCIAWQLYSKAYELAGKSPLAARAAHHMADYFMRGIDGVMGPDPERAFGLYVQAEVGYYHLIDAGLTYYQRQLDQSIEGQRLARDALQKRHLDIRAGSNRPPYRVSLVLPTFAEALLTKVACYLLSCLGCASLCGRGGIGRRARFRFWWDSREGSSPFARTNRTNFVTKGYRHPTFAEQVL